MRLLWRLLRLLLGLIYRLIVLILFERWIPFSDAKPLEAPEQPKPRPRRKPKIIGQPPGGVAGRPIFHRELGFFEARSIEPAPEQVAMLESEPLHLLPQQQSRRLAPAAAGRPLRVLLRDKRALASAIVLGEAFARRRPKL